MSLRLCAPTSEIQSGYRSFRTHDFLHKYFTPGVFPGYNGNAGKEDPVYPEIGFISSPLRIRNTAVKNFFKIGSWIRDSGWEFSFIMWERKAWRQSSYQLSFLLRQTRMIFPKAWCVSQVMRLARQKGHSNILKQVLMNCWVTNILWKQESFQRSPHAAQWN